MSAAIPLRALNNNVNYNNNSSLSARTKLIDARDHSTLDDYSSMTDDEYADEGFAAYSNGLYRRRRTRDSGWTDCLSFSHLTECLIG